MNRTHASIELPLTDAGRKPMATVGVLVAMFGLVFLGIAIGAFRHPPNSAAVIPFTVAFSVVIIALTFGLMRIIGRARATVEGSELVLHTGMGEKRIPLAQLRRHGLEIVDLTRRVEFKPRWRTWGASMPGLNTGWFRLRNGEKAVCLLTDQRRVCYLRSDSDNLSVLLSLQNPATLQQALDPASAHST